MEGQIDGGRGFFFFFFFARESQSGLAPLFPPCTTIWPKGQMGYFRNAPSENQWANRGAQFLFVVVGGGGSVCSVCSITAAGGQAMPRHRE